MLVTDRSLRSSTIDIKSLDPPTQTRSVLLSYAERFLLPCKFMVPKIFLIRKIGFLYIRSLRTPLPKFNGGVHFYGVLNLRTIVLGLKYSMTLFIRYNFVKTKFPSCNTNGCKIKLQLRRYYLIYICSY